MAKLGLILMVFIAAACFSMSVNGLGGKVGGRTKVKNVKDNKEIQDLGRYSVDQHNKEIHTQVMTPDSGPLKFKAVVEAETQVVSGTKYYLKIAASSAFGAPKTFDAEVVVKPWEHYKKLVKFDPSH